MVPLHAKDSKGVLSERGFVENQPQRVAAFGAGAPFAPHTAALRLLILN